jgi:hypothetical protein
VPFRWWAALLFVSTTINYIDRQTLSVLAPHLKEQYTWSKHRLRPDSHFIPSRILDFSGGLRTPARPARHQARVVIVSAVVFVRRDGDLGGHRSPQLRRISISPRGRRGGELAGRNQGRLRMVPEIGTRTCRSDVRQWIGCGRSDRSGHGCLVVLVVWKLAARVYHYRSAGNRVADPVAPSLSSSRSPSAYHGKSVAAK